MVFLRLLTSCTHLQVGSMLPHVAEGSSQDSYTMRRKDVTFDVVTNYVCQLAGPLVFNVMVVDLVEDIFSLT